MRARAATIFQLDSPAVLEVVSADPNRLVLAERPVVVDEWQRYPAVWMSCDAQLTATTRQGGSS